MILKINDFDLSEDFLRIEKLSINEISSFDLVLTYPGTTSLKCYLHLLDNIKINAGFKFYLFFKTNNLLLILDNAIIKEICCAFDNNKGEITFGIMYL